MKENQVKDHVIKRVNIERMDAMAIEDPGPGGRGEALH